MEEVVFQVETDECTGMMIASWDDPAGGGITTQAKDLRNLPDQVAEAVRCHFDSGSEPKKIRVHFVEDPVLTNL